MHQNDFKQIELLIKQYSANEILQIIAVLFAEQRDDLSDLGLKEQALEFSNAVDLLHTIIKK